jgi:hypothetical protein
MAPTRALSTLMGLGQWIKSNEKFQTLALVCKQDTSNTGVDKSCAVMKRMVLGMWGVTSKAAESMIIERE